ncbi:MAG: dethiobiotin synthase [Deltaproteobacteria bacterium]|nr:dethiobiotin synthase [Deltaproteobacteria bacterium]
MHREDRQVNMHSERPALGLPRGQASESDIDASLRVEDSSGKAAGSFKRAYFITATDTDAGKTRITAGLARALRGSGVDVGVMKPVETGCKESDGALVPADAIALKKAASSVDPLDLINPYRFAPPLAPSIASRMAGTEISLSRIGECFQEIAGRHGVTLVEGAGGLLVPLTKDKTIADLILYLGIPAIIVAPSRLGAINHTALTVECAKKRGIDIKGIVLNNITPPSDDPSRKYNLDEIERIAGVCVIATMPFLEDEPAAKKNAPFPEEEGVFRTMIASL